MHGVTAMERIAFLNIARDNCDSFAQMAAPTTLPLPSRCLLLCGAVSLLSTLTHLPVLVSFSCAVLKYSDKSNLNKKKSLCSSPFKGSSYRGEKDMAVVRESVKVDVAR